MKISLCSWSYNRTIASGKMDFPKLLETAAKVLKIGGIDIIAVHLPKTDKKSLVGYKKMATDLQVTICCLSPGNNFGKETQKERDREVDDIKKWIDVGFILGSPVLRIFSGWPTPYEKSKELWPKMVECIRDCEKSAREAGITLAIEPHNDGGFLPTSGDTLRLIKEINSPYVGINLDTGNYQDKDNYLGIKNTIGHAPHIHAKIHHLSPEGQELEFDYNKIFQILKDANYRGFVSVEYEGKEEEREFVPKSIEMIKDLAMKYGI